MRVQLISTSDIGGGAAIAAYRLFRGLRQHGYQTSMLVQHRLSDDPDIHGFVFPMDTTSRIKRRWRRRQIDRDRRAYRYDHPAPFRAVHFSDDRSIYGAGMVRQVAQADVINLHWAADFIDYTTFFGQVPSHIPVIWTLHDMNAFTGGCHYAFGCERYRDSCGACPQLDSSKTNDLSAQIWHRKQRAYSAIPGGRLHIVTPSYWLAGCVRASSLMQNVPVHVIPNGVDTAVFQPRDKAFSRSVLGIPEQARVVLFLADSLLEVRKGLALLLDALRQLDDVTGLFLLSLGRGTPQIPSGHPHLHLDYLSYKNEQLLSLIYSAADLFVIPTLQDNLPNTIIEAMCCGTAVVGFDVGGLSEIILPGETGQLVPSQNVTALAAAIRNLVQDDTQRHAMQHRCREYAAARFTIAGQVEAYAALFQQQLESN
ncbi:MAG: glycosyltransferase family 4 protein [Anaerolineae bacterium]|nr:glycosyltransferase family 4 protein [Anaerolineae bacterium]